ncbi:MAG: glycosyltransferase family 4 protein [Thermoguttaceae bacterium]|nr:glycosyltransferase family 4 protein [Thermoguttaceae bacterium]MBR0193675.1 glycosyltransferase family 4 protein [Thermoguttaceae bacterium]
MTTQPTTVCQLLHTLNVGGAEILASRLARQLQDERWRFVFFCLDAEGSRAMEMRLGGFPVEVLGRKPGFDWHCMRRIASLWKKYNVRFVHAHQYTPYFYAMGARGFFRRKPPILFTEHGRFYPDQPNWKHKYFNRLLMSAQDRVTAVSQSVGDAIIQNEGIPADRVQIIRNGVDENRFIQNRFTEEQKKTLRESLGLADEPVILFTARLDPIKDHVTALRAMKRLQSMAGEARKPVLLLAGNGPELEPLQAMISEMHLEKRVRLLGERTDVSDLLQIADVFLLTSKSEGIPLTILEAFASNVPVVATNVGGIPEVVFNGENGLLADSGDWEQIAANLNVLLCDPPWATMIAQNARARFEEEFTERKMLAEYQKIYEEF